MTNTSHRPANPYLSRLEALAGRPRRPAPLHLGALVISALLLGLLIAWLAIGRGDVSPVWALAEGAACLLALTEFLTRSGLRWEHRRGYVLTHIFDFVAIMPALVLGLYHIPLDALWFWAILLARATRLLDRLLGDGFLELKLARYLDRAEERVTDRVLLRLLDGVERGLDGGRLGHAVGAALAEHRPDILSRVRAERPSFGANRWAQLVGLEELVRSAEERAFDTVMQVVDSPEVDRAVRDALVAALGDLRGGIGKKA